MLLSEENKTEAEQQQNREDLLFWVSNCPFGHNVQHCWCAVPQLGWGVSASWICSRFLVWRPGYDVFLSVSLAQFWWIKDDASIFYEGGDLQSSLYQSPCSFLSSPLTCRKISLFPEKHPLASLALLQSFTDSPSVGGRLLTVLEQ